MGKRVNKIRLLIEDILIINISYLLALYMGFDTIMDRQFTMHFYQYLSNAIFITGIKTLVYYYFNMYRTIWKYASIKELLNIFLATILSNILGVAFLFIRGVSFPWSIYLIVVLLDLVLVGGSRFSYRIANLKLMSRRPEAKATERVMIVGAGDAGVIVSKELRNHEELNSEPIIFIDDDEKKQGQIINGIPVVGGREEILDAAREYKIDVILIALPSVSKEENSKIIKISKESNCKLKILPGIYELIDGKVSVQEIRDVDIEDVLGREEIKVDLEEICTYLTGKSVLVTGGGGSIGSELCRQIADFDPKELMVLDIYENSAYEIQTELLRNHPDLNLKVYIGSIRDRQRVEEILSKKRPDVIFHAAAHKHVPLMEASPKEAIKNNVFGTLNLAQLADKYKTKRFVMISTDKAVNPTNIMGASKRICEMIIQSINTHSETEFVAVRFGNVLDSNGSVVPLFKKQIEEGGPVTVTHEDVTRYFMTIPEAVQLVIQAGAMAKGGEIFILDMGEPVKILDLAKDLIRFSGFEPEVDIPIEIIGLRPGEKLYEELLLAEEGVLETKHDKIFVGQPTFSDYRLLLKSLDQVQELIEKGTNEELIEYIKAMVPTFKKPAEINEPALKESTHI